ncbi:MAG TPA: Dabb family protein [Bryobacteraceae bacterium]|nr:Dabb family protein [Bryobacteraceae bacterium]
MKTLFAVALSLGMFASLAPAQSTTVLHIINVKWKADATPEQIKAAVDAVHQLPAKYPGIKRVWTKNLKYQGQEGFKQAIVMEFESEAALKKYADSPAQKWWYEIYLPIREESRTHDIGN